MQRGKSICKELKSIRRNIAKENNIPFESPECTYEGPCKGTCPKCESEVRMLEHELTKRISLGKAVTIAGVSVSMAALGVSCGNNGGQLQGEPEVGDSMQNDTICSNSIYSDTIELVVDKNGNPVSAVDKPPLCDEGFYVGGIDEQIVEGEPDEFAGMIEDVAEFPGGEQALMEFLEAHIQYPAAAKENNISGKVFVQFTIEKDGTPTNFKVKRDIGGGCGQEAVRVLRLMPKWKPAKQKEVVVRSQYNLPITFSLDK